MKKIFAALLMLTILVFMPGEVFASIRYVDPIFEGVEVTKDVEYSKIDGQKLLLDIYKPKQDSLNNRPAIVMVHAGGFATGDKKDMSTLANEYAKKGFVVVSANYRLSNSDYVGKLDPSKISDIPAIINAQQDVQVAMRWVKANSSQLGIDKNQVFVIGSSAGAVIALLVDFNQEKAPVGREYPNESVSVVAVAAICGVADYRMVQSGDAPVIMFNAGKDALILPSWVIPFQNRIIEKGVPHEFNWYPESQHGGVPYVDVVQKITSFFFKYINSQVVEDVYDLNSDGLVNIVDIGMIISHYGESNPQDKKLDVNRDGIVNIVDIGLLIDNYDF